MYTPQAFNVSASTEIKLSKTKLIGLVIASAIFVAIGLWLILAPPQGNHSIWNNSTLLLVLGLASVLFFGLGGFVISRKLFDNTPGIVVSADGITDNSSGVSVGFIPWTDIVDIKEITVVNQPLISLVLKTPQAYINKQPVLAQKLLQLNYDLYGTVVTISANGLQCNHHYLKVLLNEYFKSVKVDN
jgi:hypothetical protein